MNTIRARLVTLLLAGLLVVLAIGGFGVYAIARAALVRQLDAGVRTKAMAMAALVTYDDGNVEFEFDEGRTDTLATSYFEFREMSGKVLRRSGSMADLALPARPVSDGRIEFGDVDLPGDVPGRAAWLAFRPRVDYELGGGVAPEELIVIAALDRGPIDRALTAIVGALVLVGGMIGITAGALVSVGVRWGLAPLDRLSRQLGAVGGETISSRFDHTGAPNELLPVYHELNRMLDRVEQTLDRERSFVNAAAHELRTPLAELRSTAEVAIRWPDADRTASALAELLAIGREMERLVECLLLLSRADASVIGDTARDVPVEGIVEACLDRVDDSIRDKGLRLTVELNGSSSFRAPPDAMEIVLRNLIDNAVQYTPPDGHVTIRDEPGENGAPSLIVENEPVALDPSDLSRLFEPFWQADGARTDRRHVGLGMAVVHQVALAVGLRVDAGLTGDRLQIRMSTLTRAREEAPTPLLSR